MQLHGLRGCASTLDESSLEPENLDVSDGYLPKFSLWAVKINPDAITDMGIYIWEFIIEFYLIFLSKYSFCESFNF